MLSIFFAFFVLLLLSIERDNVLMHNGCLEFFQNVPKVQYKQKKVGIYEVKWSFKRL